MTLRNGAEMIVDRYMAVNPDETVAIVNDGNDEALMEALIHAVQKRTEQYSYVHYPEPSSHGSEPPAYVANALNQADVGIAPTRKSISHTRARLNACNKGARVATLPGINQQIWKTALQADPDRVKRITRFVSDLLETTDEIEITTPSGTDLTVDIRDESAVSDTGEITEPHDLGNLPPGEVGTGIVDANGVYVIDSLCPEPHKPAAPHGTEVRIADGVVTNIRYPDNRETSDLEKAFESIENARNVAEFGVGTNPAAELIGNILQDEKTLGTIHIAFGDSATYIPPSNKAGVISDLHWDAISVDPTVIVDGDMILDEGTPLFMDHVPGETDDTREQ